MKELNHKLWLKLDAFTAKNKFCEYLLLILAYVFPVMAIYKLGALGCLLAVLYIAIMGVSRFFDLKYTMDKIWS